MPGPSIPIIVTRAEPGALETVQRLRIDGRTVIASPVLQLVERPDTPLPPPDGLAGLIFTSANGVRTYAARQSDRELTAWCVGPATAMAARQAGFSRVRESAGNAKDLAHFIARHETPATAPLLHVANAAAAGQLKRRLTDLGFRVAFAPLYEMRPATALSMDVTTALQRTSSGIILIHSAKGAAAFAQLVNGMTLEGWHAVAISQPASAPLSALGLADIHIATSQDEQGLFDTLDSLLATLSA
jgi:uroporphyrinogen-III synthase